MAQIIVKVDKQVKKDFNDTCEKLGISPSAIITTLFTRIAREKDIPFDVPDPSEDPFYSDENMTRLRKSIAQINAWETKNKEDGPNG